MQSRWAFFVVHIKVTIFSENGLANKGGLEQNNKREESSSELYLGRR